MTSTIVSQSLTIRTNSIAYGFGQRDAIAGQPCIPELIFICRQDQVNYAGGWESVNGPTATTAQFTGSVVPTPVVVPNYKANDKERVTRTASAADVELKASERGSKRLAKMVELTMEFLGADCGDIIFAA